MSAGGPLVADRLIRTVVHALAQILARFEMRNMLAGEGDRLSGLGIAALPRRTKMQRKASEAANFDAFAGSPARRS